MLTIFERNIEGFDDLAADGTAMPGAGLGLLGLNERATLLGGGLAHGPTSQGDFVLQAWLPWPA